jgi:hypothetical protein
MAYRMGDIPEEDEASEMKDSFYRSSKVEAE